MDSSIPVVEVTKPCRFNPKRRRTHVEDHITRRTDLDSFWADCIDSQIIQTLRENPLDASALQVLEEAYEQLAEDAITGLCAAKRFHLHVIVPGSETNDRTFDSLWQDVSAWSPVKNLRILASALVRNGQVGPYFLRTIHEFWPGLTEDEIRRKEYTFRLLDKLFDKGKILALHM